ncbi:S-adenosyl-L-methionine-dependent methyltransferase [Aaosphaeria arxii CBS 175.79]|uniref:S-adenosyl-L-methionine-dependent methyltransferase n=1 Tax=Aaosphaeria arxii CBS 175.79 TaxID=1450172 RepID=A0A6A5XKQ1_9PLEO|nr:S-adenosyl-L-methionine-dependent methyltransferase [Aaosphaeria arxii CBS 175.79]KAF2013466.1 S-adenosyl-L-methionine-dependent methyltransferase [Aaosphaeria arxii CBS 175.79]
MIQANPLYEEPLTIAALAERISLLSSQISSYISSNSLPEPGFGPDTKEVPETAEYEALRAPLNDAALDLLRLVNGPKNTLQEMYFRHYDLAALQIALDRQFFKHVPLASSSATPEVDNGSKASVFEIAEKAGMDVDRTGRVMKMLATHRIFAQVEDEDEEHETFEHTASSALLARDPGIYAGADMQMDDMLKAASEAANAISGSPYRSDASHSAFHKRFGATMYEYYEQRPDKARRFAQAMSSWSQYERQFSELRSGFAWAGLNEGKVVDIGGGNGHVSVALARSFPSLQFVVQDISPHMLSQAEEDLGHRISFQKYDFFTPQPVQDASVFLLRQCLHNQIDDAAIKIIRQVVPALERCGHGTPLLINDVILPDSGTITKYEEHHLRQIDFCMMSLLGAKQRTEKEFAALIRKADERLEIVNVRKSTIGLGLIEVRLKVEG